MKVLNLRCAQQHNFEGWFGSETEFTTQLARGLVTCPLCGDAHIEKMLSAPRLNLRASRGEVQTEPQAPAVQGTASACDGHSAPDAARQARFVAAMREVMTSTEDVGEDFADQARAMHHGEQEKRNIRGQTTPDMALALLEEGIAVLPLPHLPALKETLQ